MCFYLIGLVQFFDLTQTFHQLRVRLQGLGVVAHLLAQHVSQQRLHLVQAVLFEQLRVNWQQGLEQFVCIGAVLNYLYIDLRSRIVVIIVAIDISGVGVNVVLVSFLLVRALVVLTHVPHGHHHLLLPRV